MAIKLLFVTATYAEAVSLEKIKKIRVFPDGYRFNNIEISTLVSGVGAVATAWAMKQWISLNGKPDFALNAGIAGSYNRELMIGDVVMILSDCFADAGVEDGDKFLTLTEAGLISADEFPYKKGLIMADESYIDQMKSILKPVKGITVNTATGSETTRQRLFKKFKPDIETMEGASFFYICAMENIPFIAVRAISNRVEIRDKRRWNIPLALENLSIKLNEVILNLE